MVLLPQAAQLLVQNVGAHGKRVDNRVHIDVPNFRGFVSGSRKQLGAIGTPADLLKQTVVMGQAFEGEETQTAACPQPPFLSREDGPEGGGTHQGKDRTSILATGLSRPRHRVPCDPEGLCHCPHF